MTNNDNAARERALRVMRALIQRPFGYTKRQLADLYNVHRDTIKADFEAIRNAGFELIMDDRYRYGFASDRTYEDLKDLLFFPEEEQALLNRAIDQLDPGGKLGQRLKRRLESLYDYQKLGLPSLRRPYLTKIDMLEHAKHDKKVVVLQGYRSSNSGHISDRRVEPFHPSPADDTLQAFDLDRQELRHFRISRIERVQPTATDWQYEGHHNVQSTDPFRIVDNNQVQVHLRFRVGAYNELTERFPQTRAYIQADPEANVYDFQCKVNHRFIGLTNFILGYHHQVIEILEPDSLIDHLQKEISSMTFLEKI